MKLRRRKGFGSGEKLVRYVHAFDGLHQRKRRIQTRTGRKKWNQFGETHLGTRIVMTVPLDITTGDFKNKDQESSEVQAEIKALRFSERDRKRKS